MTPAMEHSEKLDRRIGFANKGIAITGVALVLMVVGTLGLLVFQNITLQHQLKDTLSAIKEDNARQHRVTQDYVKCIAAALLVPIVDRDKITFDNCGVEADDRSIESERQAANPSSPAQALPDRSQPTTPAQPTVDTTPTEEEDTTSAPPEPECNIVGTGFLGNVIKLCI